MTVTFTLEELTAIALLKPDKGRLGMIQAMNEILPYATDPLAASLLRGVLAKLNVCSDRDFEGFDFAAVAARFEGDDDDEQPAEEEPSGDYRGAF